ncbi:hypothetical protein [Deinococcus hohokamensis]|uniref:Uncharacterized protein n=1 Tax=Deinococcus hohokamensis TaxID=309883 RepID=A0ABV9I946_9DEIO
MAWSLTASGLVLSWSVLSSLESATTSVVLELVLLEGLALALLMAGLHLTGRQLSHWVQLGRQEWF